MPYGNLVDQMVQRMASLEDVDRYDCTIEEREEYEPHLALGTLVYAGVDYAAIVARELGIPAVVGAGDATHEIPDGQEVTVSCVEGDVGYVYEGILPYSSERVDLAGLERPATDIMLIFGNPVQALEFAAYAAPEYMRAGIGGNPAHARWRLDNFYLGGITATASLVESIPLAPSKAPWEFAYTAVHEPRTNAKQRMAETRATRRFTRRAGRSSRQNPDSWRAARRAARTGDASALARPAQTGAEQVHHPAARSG